MRALTARQAAGRSVRRRTPHRLKLGAVVVAGAAAAAAIGALSLVAAFVLREGNPICGPGLRACGRFAPYLAIVPFAALIRAAVFVRRRPWRHRRSRGFFEEVVEGVRDAALGSVAIVVFTFLFRSGTRFRAFSYSRGVFLLDWMIATAAVVALGIVVKTVLGWLRARGHNQRGVVIVGDTEAARSIEELIAAHPEMGYAVVGRIADAHGGPDGSLQSQLLTIARSERIDEVVLAVPRIDRRELSQLVGVAELVHLEVRAVPELFGLPPTKVSLETLGHVPVMGLLEEPLPGARRAVKRGMDLVLGSVAALAVSPLLLAIALAVRVSSHGPVLLRQERVGMDGRPFAMLKFRTMTTGADASAHEEYVGALIRGAAEAREGIGRVLYKMLDDPRVTRVGRLLRRLSLDELPQLWNVLRGDMSLVGPRPALAFEVALYDDWHRRRLEVRPGMTGLWQVSGRGTVGFDDMVRLDVRYIETWSPLRDLLILLRTVPAIVRKETG